MPLMLLLLTALQNNRAGTTLDLTHVVMQIPSAQDRMSIQLKRAVLLCHLWSGADSTTRRKREAVPSERQ